MFINLFLNTVNMKLFHSVIVSVFIKKEDDYETIKCKFLELFPFDLKESKIIVFERKVPILTDRAMVIIEVKLTRNGQINDLIEFVKGKLSDKDKKMLVQQIDSRVDEELNFFFRLSKPKLIKKGEFIVVDDGDCYHFKCHVATYPQDRDKGKELLTDFFSK